MEKVVLFGSKQNLVGILSVPDKKTAELQPGILIFNAGLIHHIGPFRMSVVLARSLEQIGFPVLRFDFSGIGDSGKCSEALTDEQRVREEYRAATELLTRYCRCEQFILIGLCSGADNSHLLMKGDPRIRGIVPIDGYAYPTLEFLIRDYGPGVINPRKWVKHGIRLLKKITQEGKKTSSVADLKINQGEIYERKFPPKSFVITALNERLADGMKAFYIYSGGIPVYYNYKNQFWDMFKRVRNKTNLRCNYYREADHTFSDITIRRRLIADIVSWCSQFS